MYQPRGGREAHLQAVGEHVVTALLRMVARVNTAVCVIMLPFVVYWALYP